MVKYGDALESAGMGKNKLKDSLGKTSIKPKTAKAKGTKKTAKAKLPKIQSNQALIRETFRLSKAKAPKFAKARLKTSTGRTKKIALKKITMRSA